MGQARTSQARSRDIDHRQLSNLTDGSALSGAYTLQVWSRSVACGARARGGGEVLCEKHVIFAARAGFGTKKKRSEPCVGSNITKVKTVFVC